MACETPAVITTEGGLWEQIIWGLEGIYANPFDPQVFGHAICAVLQHPKLAAQLAKFGSQKARARFTWTGVAQRILARSQSLPARVNVPEEHEQALGREERAEHLEEAPL